jgi:hypothetical protein
MAKKKALIVERIEGEHCQLPNLSNARHWMKATTTEGKWLELQREGVACLYMVLDGFVREQYEDRAGILSMSRPRPRPTDRWVDMLSERTTLLNAFAKSQGSKERGSALSYGESFNLAKHHLRHGIYVPHKLSPEECAALQQPKGSVGSWLAPELSPTATAEEVGRRWADIFAEEARVLRGNDTEQTAALHSLCDYLLAFKVGTGEGADVLARMKRESNGTEALEGFNRCKDYLLQRLDERMALKMLLNAIRSDAGLPPLPATRPPASSLWEGRTTADATDQLTHEAHYCLLSLLIQSAVKLEKDLKGLNRRLRGYRPELDHYTSALGNQRRELSVSWYHAGGSPQYGLTLPTGNNKPDRLSDHWELWLKSYFAEVQAFADEHGADAAERLVSSIAQLSIGDAERTDYEGRLLLARTDHSNKGRHDAPGDIAALFNEHCNAFTAWRVRLVDAVGANAVGAKDTTKSKPNIGKAQKWRYLKELALFHALWYAATKDANADMPTDVFAGELARDAGHYGEGAGHRLRMYYNTYCSEAGRTGIAKQRSAVVRRYDVVITNCERYPETLALAQAERTKVRSRSQEEED